MTAGLLHDLVLRAARLRPDKIAASGPDGALTYGELDTLANRMANGLAALGVKRGDRVALWQPKATTSLAAMQAVLRLGAAYVPVDAASPPARAALVMADCEVAASVVERPGAGLTIQRGHGGGGDAITRAELDGLAADPPADPSTGPDDLAYILYTSGSTGRPKGVCLSHGAALAFVAWSAAELGLRPADRLANHAPLHFDLSVFDVYAAFFAGAHVSLVAEGAAYAPRGLVAMLREERITIWYSVPSALILMIDRGALLTAELPDLRAVMFAGEPLPIKYVRALRDHFERLRLINLYGPTETNVCTFHEVRDVAPDEHRPVPIGRACSGDTVVALRDDGSVAPIGETGELVVEGPSVMRGYWGRPPRDGQPYRTGDIVARISRDDYRFVGRRDGMVKLRGHRIELGEVEACLLARADIVEAAAVVEGEGVDARLVAVLVTTGGEIPSVLELKRHCAARLPRYMIVDRVRVVNALPRTSTGKLDRRVLAATPQGDS